MSDTTKAGGWVERAMELADSFRLADELAGDEDEASESDVDRAWATLRTHLEQREEKAQKLAEALKASHSLAIGWAGHYKFAHALDDVHPLHQAVLDATTAALAEWEGK